MKSTKKIIAVVLALVMLTGCSLFCVNAATIFGIQIGEEKEEDSSVKWLAYANGQNSNVNCVYLPGASMISENGYVVVTDEKPLSIDYEFDHWEDENGNVYYPGDEFYVTGMDSLYAVWVPKADNDSYVLRVIKTCMMALSRLFGEIRKYVTIVEDFSEEYYATKEAAETTV